MSQALRDRWVRAMHALQAGVRMEMELGLSRDTEPKHLRVGVNSALVDHGALVALLVQKGLVTEEEYLTAIAEGAEREKRAYEQRLSAALGKTVHLDGSSEI